MSCLLRLVTDSDGLTATEYGLIAGLTLIAVLIASSVGTGLADAMAPDGHLGVALSGGDGLP